MPNTVAATHRKVKKYGEQMSVIFFMTRTGTSERERQGALALPP